MVKKLLRRELKMELGMDAEMELKMNKDRFRWN